MQNESKRIKKLLLAILELTAGEVQINGHVITSEEQNNAIGLLALAVGKRLGFAEQELTETLRHPESEIMQEASQLALRVAVIVNESKEYQKHGETRND